MEANINNDSSKNNNKTILIVVMVIVGIVIGYFIAQGKLSGKEQSARSLDAVIKSEVSVNENATPEQITWQNWQDIKSLSYVERGERVEELMKTNSKMVRNVEDFGVVYEISDPETGLPMKSILRLNPEFIFANSRLSDDKTRTVFDILKQDPKNPSNYVVKQIGYTCSGTCGNNGCCQGIVIHTNTAVCDCDTTSHLGGSMECGW